MTERLKTGLIGLGSVAESHLEAYRNVDRIIVVAGAEVRDGRLRELSDRHGFRPFSDYRSMLDDVQLDLACVLTPVNTHPEITEQVARRGLPVFCEKPLAVNLVDAERMVRTCRESGVKLFYGASYRYLPTVRIAREMILSGLLGDISLLTETVVGGRGAASHAPMSFAHYPQGGPGGGGMGLFDHGIHLVDTFCWLMDSEIIGVTGRGNISGDPPATEYLHIRFANGALGELLYNDATYPLELPNEGLFSEGASWDIDGTVVPPGSWQANAGSIRVHGTKGALRIFHYANQLFFNSELGLRQIPVDEAPPPAHFGRQIEAVRRSILEDTPAEVTGEDGLRALKAILAAYSA